MSGGTFLKRGQLQKKDGSLYSPDDLSVGNTLEVMGQKILIYDADKNTRDYFRCICAVVLEVNIIRQKSEYPLFSQKKSEDHITAGIDGPGARSDRLGGCHGYGWRSSCFRESGQQEL